VIEVGTLLNNRGQWRAGGKAAVALKNHWPVKTLLMEVKPSRCCGKLVPVPCVTFCEDGEAEMETSALPTSSQQKCTVVEWFEVPLDRIMKRIVPVGVLAFRGDTHGCRPRGSRDRSRDMNVEVAPDGSWIAPPNSQLRLKKLLMQPP